LNATSSSTAENPFELVRQLMPLPRQRFPHPSRGRIANELRPRLAFPRLEPIVLGLGQSLFSSSILYRLQAGSRVIRSSPDSSAARASAASLAAIRDAGHSRCRSSRTRVAQLSQLRAGQAPLPPERGIRPPTRLIQFLRKSARFRARAPGMLERVVDILADDHGAFRVQNAALLGRPTLSAILAPRLPRGSARPVVVRWRFDDDAPLA
jgi:hypothetical protein